MDLEVKSLLGFKRLSSVAALCKGLAVFIQAFFASPKVTSLILMQADKFVVVWVLFLHVTPSGGACRIGPSVGPI